VISPKAAFAALRAKSPFVDHLVRTVARYQADTGDRLAAAVTFYWFLSLFPVLLVAIYLFKLINGESAVGDVQRGLAGYLPGNLVSTISTTIGENAGKAGLIGVVGLLISGLGWIDALREAIRTIWHQNVQAGNIVTRKISDVIALVGLLATVAASVFVTGLLGSGPAFLLSELGVDKTPAAVAFTYVLGLLLAGLADVALFLFLFVRLARVSTPFRAVLRGAVFGAVGFAVLKLVGGFYVQHTTTKGEATYGTFAVVVGLLLFLNLVSRLVLLSAAFVVTGPYDSDIRPSGTADPAQARRAGIPPEYAGIDLTLQKDGAPTPLAAAVQSRIGSDDVGVEAGMEKSWAAKSRVVADRGSETAPTAPTSAADLPGAHRVQLAARMTAAAGGLVLAAVLLYVLRTVKGLVRR
jgi:membrane protein